MVKSVTLLAYYISHAQKVNEIIKSTRIMAIINGDSSDNLLVGTVENDEIYGKRGRDTIEPLDGSDYVNGGGGKDLAILDYSMVDTTYGISAYLENYDGYSYGSISYELTYDPYYDEYYDPYLDPYYDPYYDPYSYESDILKNVEELQITGTYLNDTIEIYGMGNDTINAGDGDDYINAGQGINVIDGGLGYDVLASLNLSNSTEDLDIMLSEEINLSLANGTSIAGIEQINSLTTGSGNDNISLATTGSFNGDYYYDRLVDSGAGRDTIEAIGGAGGESSLNINAGDDNDIIILQQTSTLYNEGNPQSSYIDGGEGEDLAVLDYSVVDTNGISAYLENYEGYSYGSISYDLIFDIYFFGDGFDDYELYFSNYSDSLENIEQYQITGSSGDDSIEIYGESDDTIIGGDGNDSLDAGAGKDRVVGGNGNDVLMGQQGRDRLAGKDGQDTLYGDEGNDTLYGDSESDRLFGDSGNNRLYGGDQDDTLSGGNGNDLVDGGDGFDLIREIANRDFVLTNTSLTGKGKDTISNVEEVSLFGRGGNNTLDASDVTEMEVMLFGGGGRDKLIGGAKGDILDGQGGRDRLAGKNGNDHLWGGNGRDTLFGDNGDDYLYGDSGNDVLNGGAGSDWFTIAPDAGTDTIADFTDGEDRLRLDVSLGFGDLNIVNNDAGTATLIQDANDDTKVFAILDNVMAEDITINDFV